MQLKKPSTTLVLAPLALTGKFFYLPPFYVHQKNAIKFNFGFLLRVYERVFLGLSRILTLLGLGLTASALSFVEPRSDFAQN